MQRAVSKKKNREAAAFKTEVQKPLTSNTAKASTIC